MMNMFDPIGRRGTQMLLAILIPVALVACGGGGGDAGTPILSDSGSGGSTGGTTTAAYLIAMEVQRSGAAVTQVSSAETVQAVATVTSRSGSPVSGVVVTFAESSVGLLSFQPQSATALTDASGKASVDLGAKALTGTGATTVTASATIAGVAVTGNKSIAITASATTAPTPAAIGFVSSSSQGQAIVVKGAGGSGRAQSAILEFKVLDAKGAPINGATVSFSLNSNNGGATISASQAISDSSGRVTTTVLSGTAPASIVVTATATGGVSVQSDTLLVSNSIPVQGGFEIVAGKYNLDGTRTGDSTQITAFIRDQFGNPVPDGIAVSFVTDYGAVASSTLGGCTTVNGTCSVDFRVQEPRGSGLANIEATVRVGSSTTLYQSLAISMAAGPYLAYSTSPEGLLRAVTLTSCKQSFQALLKDINQRSVAAGSTVGVDFKSDSAAVVSVANGTPVKDQLSGFQATTFGYEVDVSADKMQKICKVGGITPATPQIYFNFQFQTPNGVAFTQRVDVSYPE